MAVAEFGGVGKKEVEHLTYIYIEKRKRVIASATTLSPQLHPNTSSY